MIVVIDPGHGGKDPGAISPKGYEKNLVLSIALKLGGYIEENIKEKGFYKDRHFLHWSDDAEYESNETPQGVKEN